MKTELSTATILATPILRVAYPENFNEELIRLPRAIVQKMKPIYGWEYRTLDAAFLKTAWDEAWFASYE